VQYNDKGLRTREKNEFGINKLIIKAQDSVEVKQYSL
jgi:hypothetical protein